MLKNYYILISKEIKAHAPFTFCGALTGIFIMIVFYNLSYDISYKIFYILHPIHVLLSALVTASVFKQHSCDNFNGNCITGKCNFWYLFIISYIGSVGVATLSDSIIPYLGEVLLDMPNRKIHIGFIEKWWLINPLALIGIIIAYKKPSTRFPHAGHVLLSTYASLFHIIMAKNTSFFLNSFSFFLIILFLFIAVWIPCCVSDFVFPLLFVNKPKNN